MLGFIKKYDYVIVGAGLFGATCARLLTDKKKKVLVIEKRPNVGGNIADEVIDGVLVHKYGAHIFHTSNSEVWNFASRFCEFNNFVNCPLANYRGKLYHLPFNMNTFYELFGVKTPSEARAIIDSQTKSEKSDNITNLEEKALSMVGRTIYETLIKGYTEKQWGRSAKFLPPFIIGRLPLRFTYDNNYFNDIYQGIPIGGYSAMIERMLSGIEVRTGEDYFANRSEYNSLAKNVIYTGRIDAYFDYSEGQLAYRSLRFENKTLDIPDFQGNAVVNYTEYDVPYTRVIEHKHFDILRAKDNGKTVVTYEYPAEYVKGGEAYYPINDSTNNALFEKYSRLAEKEQNVIFGGRLASYKYFDMDDTILAAMQLLNAHLN